MIDLQRIIWKQSIRKGVPIVQFLQFITNVVKVCVVNWGQYTDH